MVIYTEWSKALLEDRHCGALSALACQGPPTPKPPCESPTCPTIACTKKPQFFKMLPDGISTYLEYPKIHGIWGETDSRAFLFSFPNDTRNFQDSMSACCAIGLKLLSLYQSMTYDIVGSVFKQGSGDTSVFWTSGTDAGCEDYFGYCSTNRLAREESRWKENQPDNANGSENCLALEIKSGVALLQDENCDKKFRYICEGRLKNGMEIVKKECALTFNISDNEIDVMYNFSMFTPSEKCFLKCFGEGADLFVNGRLLEEKIFAQFNVLAAGDIDRLMDMYSTLNYCSNLTRGMDECDKISRMIKCGRDNSPDVVQSLISSLENSIAPAPLILPPTEAVCPTFKCVTMDYRKQAIDAVLNYSNNFKLLGDSGKVTFMCGKKFFMIYTTPELWTVPALYEKCCAYGMRLMTVETLEKFQCVSQGIITFGGPDVYFPVAASRLGAIDKPKWCYSNKPLDPVLVAYLANNTDPLNYLIMMNFYNHSTFAPIIAGHPYSNNIACLSWKYNSRYWTSGIRTDSSNTSFRWCSTDKNVSKELWAGAQPDNVNGTENCAQMVIYTEWSKALLEDRHCGALSALACQVAYLDFLRG
ncbi:uncharacterized protein LOC132205819 [Neocloeon triangulifer]|uniref:uncharacterized protein LOC132205819 n=1 Tax=Neocloeon triangulifer TaxID=2078957 RepID=UPI00286FA5F5|nr:uncharacterized protein LOC132205819 [Neocloeon triangulifer]